MMKNNDVNGTHALHCIIQIGLGVGGTIPTLFIGYSVILCLVLLDWSNFHIFL